MENRFDFDFLIDELAAETTAVPPEVPIEAQSLAMHASTIPLIDPKMVEDWQKFRQELSSIPGRKTVMPSSQVEWLVLIGQLHQNQKASVVLKRNWGEAIEMAHRQFLRWFVARESKPIDSRGVQIVCDRFIALVRSVMGDTSLTANSSVGAGGSGASGGVRGTTQGHAPRTMPYPRSRG